MKHLLIITALILASGASCNEPEMADGYNFGDISKIALRDYQRVVKLRNDYCQLTTDNPRYHIAKNLAIQAIRIYAPAYPAEGICTDLFDRFKEYALSKIEASE